MKKTIYLEVKHLPNIPTRLGTVQNVTGSSINIVLDIDTVSGLTFIDGQGYRVGQLGSFVKIPIGYANLFGIVTQVGAGAVPESLKEIEPYGHRWLTAQLIGENYGDGEFKRGLSQYPTIGEVVHLVTEADLKKVYGRVESPNFISIGHLASSEAIPALIDIDMLITRHSAILGATGSGKSTTVAGIINSISDSERFPSARILLLDIHGEYAKAFHGKATIFRINPDNQEKRLCIPYWALNFEELMLITMGNLEGASRGAVLDKIMQLKNEVISIKDYAGIDADSLTVDTPIPFSIHRLWFDLYRLEIATYNSQEQKEENEALEIGADGKPVQPGSIMKIIPPKYKPHNAGNTPPFISRRGNNLRRQLEALASKLKDPRLNFIFSPGEWLPNQDGIPSKDLDYLLESWIGSTTPISILDLSGIPSEILTTLVGALLRIIYDSLFWARNLSEGGRERPLLIILEEAHTYLSKGNDGPGAVAVRRIVKEGRKYGIGAMLVSQRPSEIDSTILSQCGSIFAMRLNNSNDRSHVNGAVTDNLEGLLNMLPALKIGEAIIIGESVNLPVRAIIEPPPINKRPDSEDPPVTDSWSRKREPSDYSNVIALWREQQPRSKKFIDTIERKPIEDKSLTERRHKYMYRYPVSSSNIASIGYDESSRTLEIEFLNGSIYQYYDVPDTIYQELMQATSHGQYLSQVIKGFFSYAKV